MEDFASYGQVAPGAIEYRYTDPTQEIDQQAMGMEIQHVDRMIQARDEKEQKLDELGKQISGAYNQTKNTSLISKDNMALLNNDFMRAVEGIKEHYKTPANQRDVTWYSQLNNLKTSMVSDRIANDQKNQELYKKVENLRLQGNLSENSYNEWKVNFEDITSRGDDFLKVARERNQGGDNILELPVLSNENFITSGTQLLNSYNDFTLADMEPKGGMLVPTNTAIERFVDTAGGGLWEDAKRSFYNLPDALKEIYGTSNWNVSELSEKNAIREYMVQTLKGTFKPIHREQYDPYSRNNRVDQVQYDYYSDIINPAHMKSIGLNYKKTPATGKTVMDYLAGDGMNDPTDDNSIQTVSRSVPGATAFLNEYPEPEHTVIQIPLRLSNGKVYNIDVPMDQGINADYYLDDRTGTYNTQVFPTPGEVELNEKGQPVDSPFGMIIEGVPLKMNKTNLLNTIKGLNGMNVAKLFRNKELEEVFGEYAKDNITVSDDHIKIGAETININDMITGMLIDKQTLTKEDKPIGQWDPEREQFDFYRIQSKAVVMDPKERKLQYNMSFAANKGYGTAANRINQNQLR